MRRGDLLAEVETDKATAEIPAPAAGTVLALLAEEGAVVPVGTIVARIGSGDPTSASSGKTSATPAGGPTESVADPSSSETAAPSSNGRLPNQRLIPQPTEPGGPRRTSPAVRRLAREHGVDLHVLVGSGHRGRVTRDDVLAALQKSSVPESSFAGPASATRVSGTGVGQFPMQAEAAPRSKSDGTAPLYRPGPRDRVESLSRRRQLIAKHLKHSLDTAAHVATVAEIDMHAVYMARAVDAPHAQREGLKLTVLAYVVQAVARALTEVPLFNATIQGDEVIHRADRNVGIAVDTPTGVIVPVIHRADELGLLGLARRIEDLSQKARTGTVTGDDLAGGTFTISNPGREGNLFGISIIRQPEVGILRIGSVVKRPVVREVDGQDAIVVRPIMYAALSYDHRLIDGRAGNGFLSKVAHRLEATQPAYA